MALVLESRVSTQLDIGRLTPSQGIERAAAGDHEKPGGESASCRIEILETAKGFHEYNLGEVFGVAPLVIQESGNHTEQAILVMKNKVFKGVDFSVDNAADDLEFFVFAHSLFGGDTGREGNGSIFLTHR